MNVNYSKLRELRRIIVKMDEASERIRSYETDIKELNKKLNGAKKSLEILYKTYLELSSNDILSHDN